MQILRHLTVISVAAILSVSGPVRAEALKVAFPPPKPNAPAAPAAEDPALRGLRLVVDFAAILHVEGAMSVVAVGNPAIADASLVNHRTVIVTGHLAGTTNVIALDDSGHVLADVQVYVSSQKPGMVRVQRGTQVEVRSCITGLCEVGANEPNQKAAAPALATGG